MAFIDTAVIYVHWLLMFDSYAYMPMSVWVSTQKFTIRFEQQQQQQQQRHITQPLKTIAVQHKVRGWSK
uniref:Uncharacterized protein n=1 Tax=Glossina palpalis gambiensis TaxID=67801 RepID=A0A1B0BBA5_9MUSC